MPRVDREYLMVQSEMFLGAPSGDADADKVAADKPDLVVFNGYARQYDHAPLTARVGERVRIWVLTAGPNRGTAFHVVGGQFDTVWSEGDYRRLRPGTGGRDARIVRGPRGFVELTFPSPATIRSCHRDGRRQRGVHGIIEVTGPRTFAEPSRRTAA